MIAETTRKRLRATALPGAVVALVALGWLDLVQHYDLDAGLGFAFGLARGLPLLWCRTRPRLAWAASLAAVVVTALATRPVSDAEPWPWAVTSLAAYVVVLTLAGARVSLRESVGMAAAFVAATAVLLAALPGRGEWEQLVIAAVAAGLALTAAEVLREQAGTRRKLAEQEEISGAERTRRTLLEERARIGREMHDVVAHHMSLIAVRAETAPYRLPDQPQETREEFRAISAAARDALTDMRKLLGLLRGEGDVERAPQPTAADIPQLVRAGGDVEFASIGDLADVPAAVGVCAYRIVQESLSNARRHAPGARVTVALTRTKSELRLSVRNSAGPAVAEPHPGGGHGLIGMRERTTLVGGELTAEPTADGGYLVAAVLPLPGER